MNKTVIQAIIQDIKKECFVPEYQDKATDAEAMGLLVSKFFEWDGLQIMEAFTEALTDANFHTEAQQVQEMIEKIKE